MSYTVEWNEDAESSLTRLWTESQDRAEITASANELDAELRRDAIALGESRDGTTRIAFEPPLAITFEVFVSERRALVTAVWRYG